MPCADRNTPQMSFEARRQRWQAFHNIPWLNPTPEKFVLIAGPCVVENREMLFETAEQLKKIATRYGLPLVFKASYRKANRTSPTAFTGVGNQEALGFLAEVRQQFHLPVLTDFHSPEEAALAARYVDILQVPAFLCRQSDIIEAGARTRKPLNIKKGQFMNPAAMCFAVEKALRAGTPQVWLTERGTFFGYGDLVVDFRSVPIMQQCGVPVIVDCTHATQKPAQPSQGHSGGERHFAPLLARAAIAAGADGIFMEVHPDPFRALSDRDSQLPLSIVESLVEELVIVREAIYQLEKRGLTETALTESNVVAKN